MSKFKVGDRVKCIYGVPRGEVGTIYKYENEDSFGPYTYELTDLMLAA